jgi:hypothetical protein
MILALAASAAELTIVPRPKEVTPHEGSPLLLEDGKVAIVLGDKAVQPEEYAAETLRKNVARRFGHRWDIRRETDPLGAYKFLVLLGQRDTSRLVRERWNADLAADLPADGYVIDSRLVNVVLVGGANPRGVIYGQDTLFQLISKQGDKLALPQVTIRDRPSIPWRGRPQSRNERHLVPGTMDAYARARLNFIDLRDGPEPRRGQYGYPPGWKINRAEVSQIVKEAHRRGIFVYATVDCAVPEKDFDAAIRTCEELIALRADGLWISIDDPGAEFRFGTPTKLIERVLELGRKHGIAGREIAIVPGKESYKQILTDVNRRVARVPGMDEALWFFTPVPSAQNLEDARSIGLKTKPCWWHNWPRPAGGFTYGAYGGVSLRKDGRPAYLVLPPLSMGWGEAGYEALAEAAKHMDGIMPWGGGGWGSDYTADVLGWWAWAPELHDWKATRRRVYEAVYGPSQVDAAFKFDDALAAALDFFLRPGRTTREEGIPTWPLRPKNPADRERVKQLLAEMEDALRRMELRSPSESFLDAETLQKFYLEPAHATLEVARVLVDLPFPEYWWPAHEKRVLAAVQSGNLEQAAEWNREAKEQAIGEARRVRDALAGRLQGLDEYLRSWISRFEPPSGVRRASRSPDMKGDLSDGAWNEAETLHLTGASPGNETEVRLLYTDDALYVGFLCRETHTDRIVARRTTRDSDVWEDDSVEMALDPEALRDSYVQLIVNTRGVVFDGRRLPGKPFDAASNPRWEVKTSVGADRWTAEFRIPFDSLGVQGPQKGSIWLFNFARNDRAGEFDSVMGEDYEISFWSPTNSVHDTSALRPIEFR